MTKKDYELIAQIIYFLPSTIDDKQREIIAIAFANDLETTNNKFDRTRFLKACGIGE